MSKAGPQARERGGFASYLSQRLVSRLLGSQGWPEWLGGLLLGVANLVFFALAHKPFTIYTGFLNWGQHLYSSMLGVDAFGRPSSPPLSERTSIGDIGLFLGALIVALLAGEFKLRVPSSLLDYAEGALGGLMMALGVVLAVGCNWGGFFSSITALSLSGYLMFLGLLLGGLLGSLYVGWRAERELKELELEELGSEEPEGTGPGEGRRNVRLAGTLAAVALASFALWYTGSASGGEFAGMMAIGMVVGAVLQRSRFCFASAFRDVLSGGAEFARSVRLQMGIALGIMVGASGVLVLKYMGYVDPWAYVKPAGWSNVVGGILFGAGMVIAGGCASGSLWRAAEGHVKLWVALLAAILSYAPLKRYFSEHLSWIYGPKVSLVDALGWAWGLAFVYVTMASWVFLLLYLEYRRGVGSG